MNIFAKIGIGLGIVGVLTVAGIAVVKLVKKNEEKPADIAATGYVNDDEVQTTVSGWETARMETV